MIVPAVLTIENREPKAATVYPVDDHVPVRVSDLCAFFFQVYDMERRVLYRLIHVSVSGNIHILPPYSENDAALRSGITPAFTGPPNGLTRNHSKFASVAPVQGMSNVLIL
jgi:hypothetical protein